MMRGVPASVVVVSRGGPAELGRCLTALGQQDHPATEVVVVARDAQGLARTGLEGRAKLVTAPGNNLAEARNRGLQAAAGAVVAFTTDTVVAEPTWLGRLVASLSDPQVEAATGPVRHTDGRVPSPCAEWVDALGRRRPLAIEGSAPSLHLGAPGSAVHLAAASMAFRRETLAAMGGFDPAFPLAMGTRDLALRLAALDLVTAVVPLAQVQCCTRRAASAPPRAHLVERGAALSLFLRKHAPHTDPAEPEGALHASTRARLLRAMVAGVIMPGDVDRLLEDLTAGLIEGRARELAPLLPIGPAPEPFLPLPGTGPRPARTVAGWGWRYRRLAKQARAFAADGALVTLLHLRPGFAPQRTGFAEAGYWTQRGGLWGRGSGRGGPRRRLRAMLTAQAAVRPVDTLLD
ncbi:MAG: glycosyltransferase family 2 protein [Alkalilacustris sp.]